MASPDKKKRKHSKKTKRSSRTPSRSQSYSESYDRHQSSHYKKRKGKKHSQSQAYSSSRDRSRSHGKPKKHRRSPQRGESKERGKVSPPPFPPLWPGADPTGAAASMFTGMGFPAFFQQKIPIQLPTIPSNYKPTKASRTIKNPKTQFKGRLYIPYTYDIAMVTIHDKYLSKDIPTEIITGLAKRVVQQTEKRAKDQKQDEVVLRRIQLLNEDVIQSFKLFYNKKKKTPEKVEIQSIDESILQISETTSMNEFLAQKQDKLDQDLTDLISKIGIKYDKSNQIEFEPKQAVLLKEAKDLFQLIS